MRGYVVAAALLLGFFAAAELAYRKRYENQLAGLERRLRESHPGLSIEMGVTRFRGESAPPSLAVDLYEAARLRLDAAFGIPSRMGAQGQSGHSAWSYAFASVRLDPGFHHYLWSPRRLRFESWHGSPLADGPCPCTASRSP